MLFTSVVRPAKLERLAALNARAGGLVVAADDLGNIARLDEAARRSGRPLEVLVDVEVGGGRTGVAERSAAAVIARAITMSPSLRYNGIQGYNGTHQAMPGFAERRALEIGVLDRLEEFVAAPRQADLPPAIISGGGTGTHDIDHEIGPLTECQADSYVFGDVTYRDAVLRRNDPHPYAQSVTVRATVFSNAQPGFEITDAGAKELEGIFTSVAPSCSGGAPPESRYSIVGDAMGRIDLPAGADRPSVGAAIEIMPAHCYNMANTYGGYHCVHGDDLVDYWPLDAFPDG